MHESEPTDITSVPERTGSLIRKVSPKVPDEERQLCEAPTSSVNSPPQRHNSRQLVARLPTELLSTIFLFAYESDLDLHGCYCSGGCHCITSTKLTPYSALSVSTFWRSCVISTVSLWTVVWIRGSIVEMPKLEFIERLVARSKGRAFQVRVIFDENTALHFEEVGKVLHKHLHRCGSLHVWLEDDRQNPPSFPVPWVMPNLKEMRVTNNVFGTWERTLGEDNFTLRHPALKVLITSGQLGHLLSVVPAPAALQAIQHLEIGYGFHFKAQPFVLQVLPTLHNLKVFCWVDADSLDFYSSEPILLPKLECLFVTSHRRARVTLSIIAPRLKVLHLMGQVTNVMESIRRLEQLRDPTVEWEELGFALELDEHEPDETMVDTVLRFPTLKHLTYKCNRPSLHKKLFDRLLNQPTLDPRHPIDFPAVASLEHLRLPIRDLLFSNISLVREFSEEFSDFVRRRAQELRPPLHIFLDIPECEAPSIKAVVEANRDAGSVFVHFVYDGDSKTFNDKILYGFKQKWRPVWWN